MKVELDRDAFAAAVAFAARALPSRPAVPASGGLHVAAETDALFLSARDTDHGVSARMTVPATVTEPGSAVLPGRMLSDIAAALPAGVVRVEAAAGHSSVAVGHALFGLPLLAGPADSACAGAVLTALGSVDAHVFAEAVARVAFAAQAEANVPALCGIHLELSKTELTFVATDRFRLAVANAPWDAAEKSPRQMTLPSKSLADAARALGRVGQLNLFVDASGTLVLQGRDRECSVGALDGDYPRWQALVPASSTSSVVVRARGVADALARVALVKDRDAPVRLTFDDGLVKVSADDGHDASGFDAVEAAVTGKPVTLGVNPQLLREGLLACGSEHVRIEMTGPSRPALVSPEGSPGGAYKYLVMPVRLGS